MPKKAGVRKKAVKKKAAKKKTLKKPGLKKAVKKKAVKKRPAKKKAARKTPKPRPVASEALPKKAAVEPGPQPTGLPPVEEQVTGEEAIGIVTHYYSHLSVAVVQINKGLLKTGDRIHIKGHTTDFTQTVESMEFEHQHIDEAAAGQSVGLKVNEHAREHDIVYLIK